MDTTNNAYSPDQIDVMRAAFAAINTVNADRLAAFHKLFDGCSNQALVQLATGKIKFVSKLAVNACARRGMSVASIHVLSLVAGGMMPIDALREVCGAETVDTMIGEVYTELRAKAVR